MLDRRGAQSNFLNYHGFPAVVCISPNEVIVHGIPGDRVLEEGDIVSIDCGAIIEGWHADAAVTVPVGEIDDESKRLIDVTRAALQASIDATVAGNRLGDVGAVSEAVVDEGRVLGRARVRRPRHRHRDARGSAGARTTGPAGRGLRLKTGPRDRDRAHGERRDARRPGCSTTAGPS